MTPESVVTVDQTTAVNGLLNQIFQAIVNLVFTIVDLVVTFFSQPAILWAIAVIAVVMMVYRKFKAKIWQ